MSEQLLSTIVLKEIKRVEHRIAVARRRIIRSSRETVEETVEEPEAEETEEGKKPKKKRKIRVITPEDKVKIAHEEEVQARLAKVVEKMKKTNELVYDFLPRAQPV